MNENHHQEFDCTLLAEVFSEAITHYQSVREIYNATGYEKNYPLGYHWVFNLKKLIEIINASDDVVKKIGLIHETVMYSINTSDKKTKQKMIAWYQDYLQRHELDISCYDSDFEESVYSNRDNAATLAGRLVSPDFFRTLIVADSIKRHCKFPNSHLRFFELGAGYGGLARTLRMFFRNATSVIVDIPETLYFSYVFTRLNNPDATICYVSSPDDLKAGIDSYDYVFIPTKFVDILAGEHFDLFYNTASLGEMTNRVIAYWINFIQEIIQVDYFYGLNRFLNNIDLNEGRDRLNENTCSVLFDSHWKIISWRVDPEFAHCPYYESLVSRNIELIMERPGADHRLSDDALKVASLAIVNEIADQDWFTRPTVSNYRIIKGSQRWPLTSTRACNLLSPDLGMTGVLFKLWESIRLSPNCRNIEMMLQYLDAIEGKLPFEERFYYQKKMMELQG